jgi:UDP-N-acetylmuramoylalanine--D-glutamate ligase
MQNWQGKRVVILGAARQGLALARYLARHGARVTLNDRRTLEQMTDAVQSLADTDVAWELGGHPLSLLDTADVLAISGGVPLDNPLVVEAERRGIQRTNDSQIFMEAAPCKTIGITGSAGKTTTTTLVGRMAEHALRDDDRPQAANHQRLSVAGGRVYVGGNIGDPLVNYVDQMTADDTAVLELSSFQLEQMTASPNLAALLNITPNHLDRHGSMEAYTAAKARILQFQSAQDVAILGRDDPGAWGLANRVRGRLLSFGFSPLPAGAEGAWVRDGSFLMSAHGQETLLPVADVIELRGEHNRLNVLAACAIAFAAGFSPDAMRAGVSNFRGAPHRLEFVREWRGALWYNDSIATAPERTIAAIRSFSGPIVLMLGGRDKNLPWDDLASLIHARVDHLVLFGEATEKINAALGHRLPGQRPFSLVRCHGLKEAVQAASQVAQPGYIVLFAPGGTSFDEFKDFEERGEHFRKWVQELS